MTVTLIANDLGVAQGAAQLYAATKAHKIDILINNAGFRGQGAFIDRSLDADLAMIDLSVKALV